MAQITLHGNPINTNGELPQIGEQAKNFELIAQDMSRVNLDKYKGSRVVLNIFPSIDTGICALSVKHFNQAAAKLENTKILCVSRDTPMAQGRFCGVEGTDQVETLSDLATGDFGKDYGIQIVDGPLKSFTGRAVIVLDENHKVTYTELVPEIAQEPNYEAALSSLS
ncbi:MAG: thiol peroxidase [Arcticibacterium sp.]|jgi:thiol peroxidase